MFLLRSCLGGVLSMAVHISLVSFLAFGYVAGASVTMISLFYGCIFGGVYTLCNCRRNNLVRSISVGFAFICGLVLYLGFTGALAETDALMDFVLFMTLGVMMGIGTWFATRGIQ